MGDWVALSRIDRSGNVSETKITKMEKNIARINSTPRCDSDPVFFILGTGSYTTSTTSTTNMYHKDRCHVPVESF